MPLELLEQARTVTNLLGDAGRRTIIERLAGRPQAPADSLRDLMGMCSPDIYHRLRSLRRNNVLTSDRMSIYSVNPSIMKLLSRYFDILMVTASLNAGPSERPRLMTIDLDAILEALADPTRRQIFERIIVRPSHVGELAKDLPVTRPAVSHHVRILREAGLVRDGGAAIEVVVEVLPMVRLYFERLWLEASLGDAWLAQRGEQSRLNSSDAGSAADD